jgi:protein involved in ribonucleotide reduction
MKGVSYVSLCMILSSIFPIALSSWLILEIIAATPAPALLYAQSCKATTVAHYSGTPIIGRTVSHLTVVNEVNNTGCSTDCMSANSTVTVLDNSEKPIIVKASSAGMTVTLGSGDYRVIPTRVSGFYEQTLSSNCSGIINSGETKKCIIINSYSNNVQTWVDRLNNIKIQFSYSPPYPFVGNISQLSFQATNSSTNKPLQISHIHVALITNVTASFNNSKTINNKNDFVTFDNLSSNHGIFSLKYQFLAEGTHQIIVKINTVDNESLLASFDVPVLFPE